MLLRPIALDESLIGQPLPWDIYNASGVLLAAEGMIVETMEQYQRLTSQSQFIQLATGDARPMVRLGRLLERLGAILATPWEYTLDAAVKDLAEELRAIYQADPDACLGLARVIPCDSPSVRHAVQTALVVYLLGRSLDDLPEAELASAMAAAMTMNIAAIDLHDALARGTAAMNPEHRATMEAHPTAGAELLIRCGVSDPLWLNSLRQHHENLDGTGYPARLEANDILLPARMIRLADYYCAKLSGRHYRLPKTPEFAFRALFGEERGQIDSQLATLLLRRIGIYPPGTLVRLNNHETAIITRRSHPAKTNRAVSFLNRNGHRLSQPKVRDLNQRHFAIHDVAISDRDWPEINWETLWGY